MQFSAVFSSIGEAALASISQSCILWWGRALDASSERHSRLPGNRTQRWPSLPARTGGVWGDCMKLASSFLMSGC